MSKKSTSASATTHATSATTASHATSATTASHTSAVPATSHATSATTAVPATSHASVSQVETVETVVTVVSKGGFDEHVFESENEYNELQSELTKLQEQVSLCKNKLKKFYKLTCKEVSKATKNKKNSTKRSPTGFDKPCDVPSSLKTLLSIGEGEQVARPVITKKIYEYIDTNNLRDTTDKRVLRVNDSLAKALSLTSQEVKVINASTSPKDKSGLNFYNIQKYIKKLYPASSASASSSVVSSSASVVSTTTSASTKTSKAKSS